MKVIIEAGATNQTFNVFIQDSSATTGTGLTGLTSASSGLTCYYMRTRGAATVITLATLASPTASHKDGGFIQVHSTYLPGIYRLDIPDAVCATGVQGAAVMLKGATNMAPLPMEIQLANYDLLTQTTDHADALLGRNIAGGSTGGRTVTQALRPLRNKTSMAADGLTFYVHEEDDSTTSWQATVARTASLDPITTVTPAT